MRNSTLAGDFLRDTRLNRGLTQKQLATLSYTTQSVISRLERNQYSPTIRTLTRLVEVMGARLVLEDGERES